MIEGVASRTALAVARHRAAHQVLDNPPVFRDPLAQRIAAAEESGATRGLRAFLAVRSRFAEDELGEAFVRGTRQYVVLGAGLDTFGYRNPHAPLLKVFEVDHPATQAWKKERLEAVGIDVPAGVVFVPVDFEREQLAEGLGRVNDFDGKATTLFSMLGVTPYLTRVSLLTTLEFVASMVDGSGIVFDYVADDGELNRQERRNLRRLANRVASVGEKFRLSLKPSELARMLSELGFGSIVDVGKEEINSRYFSHRQDGMQVESSIGRLVSARLCK